MPAEAEGYSLQQHTTDSWEGRAGARGGGGGRAHVR